MENSNESYLGSQFGESNLVTFPPAGLHNSSTTPTVVTVLPVLQYATVLLHGTYSTVVPYRGFDGPSHPYSWIGTGILSEQSTRSGHYRDPYYIYLRSCTGNFMSGMLLVIGWSCQSGGYKQCKFKMLGSSDSSQLPHPRSYSIPIDCFQCLIFLK